MHLHFWQILTWIYFFSFCNKKVLEIRALEVFFPQRTLRLFQESWLLFQLKYLSCSKFFLFSFFENLSSIPGMMTFSSINVLTESYLTFLVVHICLISSWNETWLVFVLVKPWYSASHSAFLLFLFGIRFLFPALGGLLYGYDTGATSSARISLEVLLHRTLFSEIG